MTVESAPSLRRAGVLVGVTSGLANVLGFVFLAMLSRAYSPGDYGEISALLGLGAIGSVASVAVQLLIARQVASGRPRGQVISARAVLAVGLALFALTVGLAPVLQPLLHVQALSSFLWLGGLLVPFTLAGALEGHLLGAERFAGYAAGLLLISGARVVTGLFALGLHSAVPETMAILTLTTVVATAILGWVTGQGWWWRLPLRGAGLGSARELLAILSGISAFLVLSGLDLLLARHYLDPVGSGVYAIGNLFTKAGLWGPQFVAVVVFPRLSAGAGRSLLLRAVAVVTGIGVAGSVLTAALGPWIVTTVSGASYSQAGHYAWLFATLGILLALAHLVLLNAVAEHSHWASWGIWVTVAAEAVVVGTYANGSLPRVLLTSTLVVGLLVLVGLAMAVRPQVRPPKTSALGVDAA